MGASEQCRAGWAACRDSRVKLHRGRERRLQGRDRAWVSEGGDRRRDPVLALTLTHSVTLGKALALPGPRFPHLLTGINDLSLKPPPLQGPRHRCGWVGLGGWQRRQEGGAR